MYVYLKLIVHGDKNSRWQNLSESIKTGQITESYQT